MQDQHAPVFRRGVFPYTLHTTLHHTTPYRTTTGNITNDNKTLRTCPMTLSSVKAGAPAGAGTATPAAVDPTRPLDGDEAVVAERPLNSLHEDGREPTMVRCARNPSRLLLVVCKSTGFVPARMWSAKNCCCGCARQIFKIRWGFQAFSSASHVVGGRGLIFWDLSTRRGTKPRRSTTKRRLTSNVTSQTTRFSCCGLYALVLCVILNVRCLRLSVGAFLKLITSYCCTVTFLFCGRSFGVTVRRSRLHIYFTIQRLSSINSINS